jgi:hypothetical protein
MICVTAPHTLLEWLGAVAIIVWPLWLVYAFARDSDTRPKDGDHLGSTRE